MHLRKGRPPAWASLRLGLERRHRHPFLSHNEPNYGGKGAWGTTVDRESQPCPPLLGEGGGRTSFSQGAWPGCELGPTRNRHLSP